MQLLQSRNWLIVSYIYIYIYNYIYIYIYIYMEIDENFAETVIDTMIR